MVPLENMNFTESCDLKQGSVSAPSKVTSSNRFNETLMIYQEIGPSWLQTGAADTQSLTHASHKHTQTHTDSHLQINIHDSPQLQREHILTCMNPNSPELRLTPPSRCRDAFALAADGIHRRLQKHVIPRSCESPDFT